MQANYSVSNIFLIINVIKYHAAVLFFKSVSSDIKVDFTFELLEVVALSMPKCMPKYAARRTGAKGD